MLPGTLFSLIRLDETALVQYLSAKKKTATYLVLKGYSSKIRRSSLPYSSREDFGTSTRLKWASLQVDRNGQRGSNNGRPDSPKPWGKPSRFSGSDNLELGDIVRGVFPPVTEKNPADEEDEEYDEDEEEYEDEEDMKKITKKN